MVDTIDVNVNPDTWVAINNSATDGFITNTGLNNLVYREAASQPAASLKKGHFLPTGENISFGSLAGGQSVWGRSVSGDGVATMTES